MLPRGRTIKCFATILNADKSLEANLENKHGGPCRGRLFGVKLSLILGIMNSTDRREEKRNFLIQGRRFRRSFKNYCNYRYFMKLSQLSWIVKLGIDVLLLEHLQSRCIDSSMYRSPLTYTAELTSWLHLLAKQLLLKQSLSAFYDVHVCMLSWPKDFFTLKPFSNCSTHVGFVSWKPITQRLLGRLQKLVHVRIDWKTKIQITIKMGLK